MLRAACTPKHAGQHLRVALHHTLHGCVRHQACWARAPSRLCPHHPPCDHMPSLISNLRAAWQPLQPAKAPHGVLCVRLNPAGGAGGWHGAVLGHLPGRLACPSRLHAPGRCRACQQQARLLRWCSRPALVCAVHHIRGASQAPLADGIQGKDRARSGQMKMWSGPAGMRQAAGIGIPHKDPCDRAAALSCPAFNGLHCSHEPCKHLACCCGCTAVAVSRPPSSCGSDHRAQLSLLRLTCRLPCAE